MNDKAQELYNDFTDFEASFLDLIALIGEKSPEPNSNGNPSLHLFWRHLYLLNERLHGLLSDLSLSVAGKDDNCDTGAAGAAIESKPESCLID